LLECTPVNCASGIDPYHLAFTYDLAGNTIQSTNGIPNAAFTGNPSPADLVSHYGNTATMFNGIAVPSTMLTAGYDSAGRLSGLTSSWADSGNHPATLFQATSTDPAAPAYGPAGLENATLGHNPITLQTVATMTRAYDNRLRLISENDIGAVSQGTLTEGGTGSTGSITIRGTEDNQVTRAAAPATGQITVYGAEHSHQVCTGGGQFPLRCNTFPDFGSLSVSVNGFNASASYGVGSDDPTVAQALATALSASGSPVTATTGGTNVVTITSVANGASANYAYSITCALGSDFCGNVSGSTLTGGTDAGIVYDAGTISATINGGTVSVPWSSTSNANSIASALATAIQSADSGFLRLTVSGPTITLYSTTPGAAANWSVMASADDSLPPTTPSFSVMTSGMSGGTNGTVTPGLLYGYAIPTTGGFAPNGNLMNVSDTVMGSWSYGYDNLNRLTTAVAGSGSYMGNSIAGATLGWQYDSFGNRNVQSSNFAGIPTGSVQFTGANNQATGTGLASSPSVSVDTLQYDAAGNLTGKDGTTTSLYDGEGRLCATANTTGGYTQYVYDSDGNRVAKGSISSFSCNLASNGFSATNSYVLSASGQQLTEINLQTGQWKWDHSNVFVGVGLLATYSNPASGFETTFALNDWLGTKRVEITPDGKISSFASLFFGDGLASSGTAADATEHHFTGKNRDAESGNDYFGLRYYESNIGRFVSPDPSGMAFTSLSNPQSFNMYAYVQNNPLNAVDPDGLECLWSDGSYDSKNDPDTGSSGQCKSAGGQWIEPDTMPAGSADWTDQPNQNMADYYARGEELAAEAAAGTLTGPPTAPDGGDSSSSGMTTTIDLFGANWASTQVRHGTIPFRDNNEGDLRPGRFKTPGVVGTDVSPVSGRFRVFGSMADGHAGMDALLHSATYFNLSINDAVSTYAPGMENNTAAYQQFLTNTLHVSGNTPLSSLSPAQFHTLERAITVQEGLYKKINYAVTTTTIINP